MNADLSAMNQAHNVQTEIYIIEGIIATLAPQAEEFVKELTK